MHKTSLAPGVVGDAGVIPAGSLRTLQDLDETPAPVLRQRARLLTRTRSPMFSVFSCRGRGACAARSWRSGGDAHGRWSHSRRSCPSCPPETTMPSRPAAFAAWSSHQLVPPPCRPKDAGPEFGVNRVISLTCFMRGRVLELSSRNWKRRLNSSSCGPQGSRADRVSPRSARSGLRQFRTSSRFTKLSRQA